MSIEVQTNAALALYLSGLGVATPNPVDLANSALAKDAKEKAEKEGEAIAGLIGGAKAAITAAAIEKFEAEKKASKADEKAKDYARAMSYLLSTGNKLPLQKLMGLPIRKDLEESAKIPDGWTPGAAAAATTAAA